MSESGLPQSSVDELVDQLFGESSPSRFDDALYIGPRVDDIVESVERYCDEDNVATPPSATVVTTDAERARLISGDYERVSTAVGEYIDEEFTLDSSFDYVACVPPDLQWEEVSTERRSAIANNFGQITVDDEEVNPAELYLSRAIRDIKVGARGLFLTEGSVLDANATATLWDQHYYRIDRVTRFGREHGPSDGSTHALITITNDSEDWETSFSPYDPETHEESLNSSLVDVEEPFTAGAIMTVDPTTFAETESVADVYIDMMVADFDAAPVTAVNDQTDESGYVGYVSRGNLRTVRGASIAEQVRPFTDDVTVSKNSDIGRVIH